ncbi:hypothetical protein B0T26DRAFT_724810 [Lasiosphaeria miniovina]|uniref:Uncharacterized protein n=1 Tax=Lasiosphaeria miniovina TaxID=1954250 RepID=A0AA39ZYB9_9PEZI|nr:uncharacterized protein B0T26DRAFT_724810 [Lasiosphaeria miniovina]KAK0705878.1 hypothetical protein B0T26DRAFT_724810 [Lasiosphaeria miniovina]
MVTFEKPSGPPEPTPNPSSGGSGSNGSVSSASVAVRQFSSLVLVALLYTAATPFEPFSWLLGPMATSGSFLFDRLLAGLLLFCAFYFQWRVASLRRDLVVSLPLPAGGGTQIRNGRIETTTSRSAQLWLWQPRDYWPFAVSEAALLIVAEFVAPELLRRAIVAVVLAGLWVLGWSATPQSYKRWAWEHIKVYLFVLVLDEIRRIGWSGGGGGGGGRRAARGRGRW